MKFYCLHEGFYEGVQLRLDQLKAACCNLNIEFVAMNSLTVDYSNLPILTKDDLLYNAARGSEVLETILLNKEVTTFYIHNPDFVVANPDTTKYSILHDKANIPSPKTIYHLTNDRALLKKYVDYLGGFPIIIKAAGSTRGIGTIKIDSWQNLISTVDYLITTGDKFILRQFIENKGAARIIVLGNEVIATEFRDNIENDFRVSGNKIKNYYQRDFDEQTYQIAINATRIANLEVSGVDIIYDMNKQPYLLEMNTPFDFIPTQEVTNINIAELMIKYLTKKSKK